MNKKTKTSIIMSSLAAMLLAGSMIAGATYALFTSESKTNIAVTSGKVDVTAAIENLAIYSPTSISTDEGNAILDGTNAADQDNGTFANGGTAVLSDNSLALSNLTPGDKATFDIKIHNGSNVKVMYRTALSVEDEGLFDGLEIKIDDAEIKSTSRRTTYENLEVGSEDKILSVSISLPTTAGKEYEGSKCEISFAIEAVQGNAFNGVYNVTPDTVQNALDNASDGDTIILGEGDYGTLYFRQSEKSKPYSTGDIDSGTNKVEGEKVTYTYHPGRTDVTYMRTLKDITIVGSENAKGDNIEFMDASYKYAEDTESAVSGNIIYNEVNTVTNHGTDTDWDCRLFSFFTIDNLTFQGITFTGEKTALKLSQQSRDAGLEGIFIYPYLIDGLHFDECSMTMADHEGDDIMLLQVIKNLEITEQYKNISIENCNIQADRVIVGDGLENVTIRNNVFKNIKNRDILLSQGENGQDVKGRVLISNNSSDGSTERFIRIGDAQDINLYILNNKVTNYQGADSDYIKSGKPNSKLVSGNSAVAADGRTLTINIPD